VEGVSGDSEQRLSDGFFCKKYSRCRHCHADRATNEIAGDIDRRCFWRCTGDALVGAVGRCTGDALTWGLWGAMHWRCTRGLWGRCTGDGGCVNRRQNLGWGSGFIDLKHSRDCDHMRCNVHTTSHTYIEILAYGLSCCSSLFADLWQAHQQPNSLTSLSPQGQPLGTDVTLETPFPRRARSYTCMITAARWATARRYDSSYSPTCGRRRVRRDVIRQHVEVVIAAPPT
jgi:hypothetical protein